MCCFINFLFFIPPTCQFLDFTRGDVTDLTNCADKLSCSLPCKLIRMGTYRFEPTEQVSFEKEWRLKYEPGQCILN